MAREWKWVNVGVGPVTATAGEARFGASVLPIYFIRPTSSLVSFRGNVEQQ